ncbi:hypothetical protein B0H67DRAFT_585655 [Lasiosphaeris hirsuta]|uniref:Pentatricopeptide repeat protein n=1 Tax=Lasiosphaeris hirsuta TaxID=260670 RepID=A0AA40DSD0_9PEZI|nr:hypothetical protein B0H67DRAFT_585655 [Lasiosphaeris hirsuta]
MFVCRSCVRKTIGPTAAESRLLVQPLQGINTQRSFSGESYTSPSLAPGKEKVEPTPPVDKSDPTTLTPRRAKDLEWVVKKHLQYLKDPLLIAEHILATLAKGKFEEALEVTRAASRDTAVSVSWNHLIDYQMKNQRLHAAVKLYNEMKKRAQLPDARTYTIIFRGCAQSIHPKLAVSEAVRIYSTLMANERIKPSTIHLNAVLEVCARAGDIDSMFTIAQTANNGLRAPNSQTYTIILNGLRHKPDVSRCSGLSEEQIETNNMHSIEKAKAIWDDIIFRWKSAKLVIDEELVCSMGRLLMSGDRRDKDSILELLEQTMALPRFDKGAIPGSVNTTTATTAAYKKPHPRSPSASSAINPKPGRNTLSLIMMSLQETKKTSLAPKYWGHLTKVHNVEPDKDNYNRYLKVLQVGRASEKMANTIVAMPPAFFSPMTFRTGFSTCIHDELSPHAFQNACRIFDVMIAKTRYPDPLAMRLFLQSARGNVRHHYEKHSKDEQAAKLSLGRQIVAGVDRLWQPFRILMSSFSYPEKPAKSPLGAWQMAEGDVAEAMATARRMIAAMDKVTFEGMADDEICKILKTRRSILNRLVERYYEKEQKMAEKSAKVLPAKEQGGLDEDLVEVETGRRW